MPALIANGKGQAQRVTLYLPDDVFQFFAGSAFRTLLKAPPGGNCAMPLEPDLCAASENLKPIGDTFFLQILNYSSRLCNGPVFQVLRKYRTDRGIWGEVDFYGAA
jgi:hypothetical protein